LEKRAPRKYMPLSQRKMMESCRFFLFSDGKYFSKHGV
jgi:hypothetical protein